MRELERAAPTAVHRPWKPVGEYLLAAARERGARRAVVCGELTLDYATFAERAARLAAALIACGVRSGDRVAYLGPNCHTLLEAYFGVPWADAVLVPLHARLTRLELATLLRDAEPRVLIVDSTLLGRLPPLAPQELAARVVVGTATPGWLGYESWLGSVGPAAPVAARMATVSEMFYTSGSTGRPRGVKLSAGNLEACAAAVRSVLEIDEHDVVLHALSLFHANGWGFPHAAVMAGATQVVLGKFVPARALTLLQRHAVTLTYLVPTMARGLLDCRRLPRADALRLRGVVVGGAAATPELAGAVEDRLGGHFVGSYGLTETSPVLTLATLLPEMQSWSRDRRLVQQASAGRPVPGARLRLLDAAGRDILADGESVGEVQVAGDLVMSGYWRRPEETARALVQGWLRTGDLATVDRWGYLRIVGRTTDLFKSGGETVVPAEVERVLAAHPSVREAAVIGAPHPRLERVPVAYVVPARGATVDQSELRRHCARSLAAFKLPRVIRVVPRLPHTPTGKIARTRLRAPSGGEAAPGIIPGPARDD